MIPDHLQAEILRLRHVERWKIGTIARHLGVHHEAVRRVLDSSGRSKRSRRSSLLDPYLGFIRETLERYPRLCASRLYDMCRERGYLGGPDHFRHRVARLRPRPAAEAFLRLRTLPGDQGQIDWAHFGHLEIGRARRPLMAFVCVLSWSRHLFVRFFLGSQRECFVRGHVLAFEHFGGVPRRLLYDNLKSAVLERRGDAIRFNDHLLDLAKHYHFEAIPVAPYRGNEKGRVERAIRFVRDRFFAGQSFKNLADLNEKATRWTFEIAAKRPWPQDKARRVEDVFEEERPSLIPLPDAPFETLERREVRIGKTPYARFDTNDYSVPHDRVRRTLVVWASETEVRIEENGEVLARHPRSYDRGAQIEDPAHLRPLIEKKKRARHHRGFDRLTEAAPSTDQVFRIQAQRGTNIGSLTARLLELLDLFGGPELEAATKEALLAEAPHAQAIRQILDRRRRARGLAPARPVILPKDPRLEDVRVRPHDLRQYDELVGEEENAS